MAPRPYYVKFTPSGSADVVGYNIYIQPVPDPIHPESQYVRVQPPYVMDNSKIKVDLLPLFPDMDGEYTVGITAVDDMGNESSVLQGVTNVDFVVPDAPTDLEFEKG